MFEQYLHFFLVVLEHHKDTFYVKCDSYFLRNPNNNMKLIDFESFFFITITN